MPGSKITPSTDRVCWQPPSRLAWRESLLGTHGASPPELLSRWLPAPGWRLATWGRFRHSSLCSPVSCLLPPPAQPARTSHSARYSVLSEPWPHDYLCADCQAAEFLEPLILSLFFPRGEEGEEVLFFLQLERCPPRLGCHVPWVSATTAGLHWPPEPCSCQQCLLATLGQQEQCRGGGRRRTSPDWQISHINSYLCLIIYYVLLIWHIFPFNLCNDRTKSVLPPSAFLQLRKLPKFFAAIR